MNLPAHLDLIAAAPDGIRKLRGLILELAVRGKLVAQDPNDEPAGELLKRIARERARLEAEGTCKKSKAMPLVGEDEQPFALPLSWTWTRLGEITNFGQTDKDGEIRDSTWVLDLEDIQKDTSVLLRKVRFAERQAKSDKNRFQDSDVLYGKLRPYLNKVIVADEDGVCTTEILPIRGYYGLFPRYLMYAVKRPDFLAYVNSKSYGMKMPRLGTDEGRLALFPLPPLAEQHRIVAKVDELMALCDRLEAEQADADAAHARLVDTLLGTLTQSAAAELAANWQRLAEHFDTLFTSESSLDALKQTVLQLAVMGKLVPQDPNDEPASELIKRIALERARLEAEGTCKRSKPMPIVGEDDKPFEIPASWEWVAFCETWESSFYGPRFGTEEYVSVGGVPTIRTTDMQDGAVVMKSPPRVNVSADKLSLYQVKRGDLLVTRSGSIGTLALFESIEPAIPSAYLIRLRFLPELPPRYFKLFLVAPLGQGLLGLNTTSVGVPNVSASRMAEFPLPLPPLAEQHRIVAKVDELLALCDRLQADLAGSRARQERLAATLIESALQAA
jgi:type I restriction enzyme S subunit